MTSQVTKVSSPGKVLICGGYYILDPRFSGLVCGIDSRFYVSIQNTAATSNSSFSISVNSPQFIDGTWDYTFCLKSLKLKEEQGSNFFVRNTLDLTLKFILSNIDLTKLTISNLKIKIVGDNDFYSQSEYLNIHGLSNTFSSLNSVPKFNQTNCKLSEVHKTGLGSSAALVTSLVGALLIHYGVVSLDLDVPDRTLIEKLSHCSHVISQGKVGSGFDISAACYGTHIYKRFKPYLLEPLLNMTDLDPHIIREVIDSNWDNSLKPFRIPHGLYLQLGEVKGGTNTPKMVFKLLKWRESNVAECMLMLMIGDEVWIKLQAIQDCILSKFNQLNQYYSEQPQCYEDELSFYGGPQLAQTKFSSIVDELIINFRDYRSQMKLMGILSGVPIEPDAQTIILDKCLSIPNVIAAFVPGAGGNDAIYCIGIGSDSHDQLLHMWSHEKCLYPLIGDVTQTGFRVENINF